MFIVIYLDFIGSGSFL